MVKKLASFILFGSLIYANEYFAKLEPIQTYNIKSSVSGKIIFVDSDLESQLIKNKTIIKIDSKLNQDELNFTKEKLTIMQNIVTLEKHNLDKMNKIRSKSQLEKDNQKIKILNLEASITDLQSKIKTLQDQIYKKNISISNLYIYDIAVKKDDYVNPGSLLLIAMDISKAKLEFFVSINDIDKIKQKRIYLNGKETNYKLSKVYQVSDKKHISSYKCEIVIDKPKQLSKLFKIEFK